MDGPGWRRRVAVVLVGSGLSAASAADIEARAVAPSGPDITVRAVRVSARGLLPLHPAVAGGRRPRVGARQANVRVDWIHTPGSDLFLVLDTGYFSGDLADPGDERWVRRTGVVKLTYLWAF